MISTKHIGFIKDQHGFLLKPSVLFKETQEFYKRTIVLFLNIYDFYVKHRFTTETHRFLLET